VRILRARSYILVSSEALGACDDRVVCPGFHPLLTNIAFLSPPQHVMRSPTGVRCRLRVCFRALACAGVGPGGSIAKYVLV